MTKRELASYLNIPHTRTMTIERQPSDTAGLHKIKVAVNEKSRNVGFDLVIAGVEFTNYRLNPLVLFNHDDGSPMARDGISHGLPIARTEAIDLTEDDEIIAAFRFRERGPGVQEIREAWEDGDIRTASIRWIPLELKETNDGLLSVRSDMLEWSLVTIPADPGAEKIRAYARQLGSPGIELARVGMDEDVDRHISRIVGIFADRLARIERELKITILQKPDGDESSEDPEEGKQVAKRQPSDEEFAALDERVGAIEETVTSITSRLEAVEEELGMDESNDEDGSDDDEPA